MDDAGMSEDNGNRATVALVYHAIGEVKELTARGFSDVQRQLDRFVTMPETVAKHDEQLNDHERRLDTVEQTGRDALPRLLSLGAFLFALASLAVQVFH